MPPSYKIVKSLFFMVPLRRKVSEEELPNKACKMICEFAEVGFPMELSCFKLDDCRSISYSY